MAKLIPDLTGDDAIPDPGEVQASVDGKASVKSSSQPLSRRDQEILADRPPHHG
jgi:hypothetical protein